MLREICSVFYCHFRTSALDTIKLCYQSIVKTNTVKKQILWFNNRPELVWEVNMISQMLITDVQKGEKKFGELINTSQSKKLLSRDR